MLNRKYYPFERSSFYPGKLLTARDFEAEQSYYNDKRRLVNRLRGGNGIVAGLGVIMADDASVILQAGCAFDASGREIVVPQTRVVKLSTIEGFDQLTTSNALLGICYDEQPEDEVYSVMSGENGEPRHNKIRETYRLTLVDESMAARVPEALDAFVTRQVVYADPEVEVTLYVPAFLPRGCRMRVRLRIARISAGMGDYAFSCRLHAPGFRGAADTGESPQDVRLSLEDVRLSHGEEREAECVLAAEDYIWGGGAVTLRVEDFAIRRGEESFSLGRALEAEIAPSPLPLREYYLAACYGRPMDKDLAESYDERLWLARVLLLRRGTSVILDRVLPSPFGQYSYNAQQLMELRMLEEYFSFPGAPEGAAAPAPVQEVPAAVAAESGDGLRGTACGVINLSLGMGADQRGPAFSEEIMHGLGKGPVYVDVGVEYITAEGEEGTSGEILLGDASIFAQHAPAGGEERTYQLTTGVKVLPERGTFIVGVKLGEPTGLITLRIRWYAMRLSETNKQLRAQSPGERMIVIKPDTILLPPKGTVHVTPVFVNMPGEACRYRVMDPEGGTIDQNGLYTAPAREGAYEIRVEAISDPSVFAYAFAIVSQKKKED